MSRAWVVLALIALLAPLPVPAEPGAAESAWIVLFEDAPLARSRVPRARNGRIDPRSAASRRRLAEIDAAHSAHLRTIAAAIGRSLEPAFRYRAAANGMVLHLTGAEAEIVGALPGVVRVMPDALHRVLTDRTPSFVGADQVWAGVAPVDGATLGEGVVVGVIDSGVNMDHPSFSDAPDDGHVYTNPLGAGSYLGWCDPAHPEYDAAYLCNDKLIGAWDFVDALGLEDDGPEDDDGHGSHVASTAVGNRIDLDGDGSLDVSGIAPHAQLVVYDACYLDALSQDTFCPRCALLAAIDQAVLDAVDVVNFSISGGTNPWVPGDTDWLFLSAVAGGAVPVAAAGNDGPVEGTVEHLAPWVIGVAATTHDRAAVETRLLDVSGGDVPPGEIGGAGRTGSYGPAPVVWARDFANGDPLPEQCLLPFPAGTFVRGEIVLCDRGEIPRVEKCANVADGGAGGCILADVPDGDPLGEVADVHVIPALHVDAVEGELLRAWLASGTGHTARIGEPRVVLDAAVADTMADFSSRGPARSLDVLKPDLGAPGVDVFAAGADATFDVPGLIWRLQTGTSMSSPHVAGAAALLRALHPAWPPAAIRSALATTAASGVLREDGATPADPFDRGSGRLDVEAAARAGVVLLEDVDTFLDASPATGGDPRLLNVADFVDSECSATCGWRRRLTSVAPGSVEWRASAAAPQGVTLEITPETFVLAPGETAPLSVRISVNEAFLVDSWSFSDVILVPDDPALATARLPLAVFPTRWVPAVIDPLDATAAARVKLRFDRFERDSILVKLTDWAPGAALEPAGLEFALDLGGAVVAGTLDSRGRLKGDGERVKLKRRRDGSYTLKVKRKKTSFADSLADEGLLDEDNAKPGKPVTVDVLVQAGTAAWSGPIDLLYRSKAGRIGLARP